MDNKVLEGLYIGDLTTSKNEHFLSKHSITHILSMLEESSPHFQNITYLCLDISDSPLQRIAPVFGECLEFIHRARASGGAILVHCSTGVSRCATIVAAYLLVRTELSMEQTLQTLTVVRPCTNPNHGFRRQLEDWSMQHRKRWVESMKRWPQVAHDDQERCLHLLAAYNGEKPAQVDGVDSNKVTKEQTPCKQTEDHDRSFSTNSNSTLNSEDHCTSPHTMGNSSSASVYSLESENQKPSKPSRLEKIRNSLRSNSAHKKNNKEQESKRKYSEDTENNNKTELSPSNGLHYPDNVTRSSTLPNNIHKVSMNGGTTSPLYGNTMRTRLLPAYKPQQAGIIGNIQNRQRMISTPSYPTRSRMDSQSSAFSHRYSTCNRSPATHIPAHLDKRLVRSKSVGVIPPSELRMRRAASASVVKLADCEDWIV